MTGELTAQGIIDFSKSSLFAVPTATLVWPGGNTRRYSIQGSPLASTSLGIFRDRILDISDIDFRTSDPGGGLQTPTTRIRLADIDGDIRSIVSRYGPGSLRGSSAVIDYATKSAVADWPRRFTGIVDAISLGAGGESWELDLRVDDRALYSTNFKLPRYGIEDFRSMVPKSVSSNPDESYSTQQRLAVCLGIFDSRDGTSAASVGSVPLIRTGQSDGSVSFPYRYAVAANNLSHVKRVTNNGATVSSSTWIRAYVVRNGIAMTEVWFSSDPGATAKMAAEIHGNSDGDTWTGNTFVSSGFPVINFVKQMRHLLRNYIFNGYRQGAPTVSDSGLPISTSTWDSAETWAEQRRIRGCFYITDQSPIDVFNAFCQWAWVRAGWNRQGQLAIYPFADEDVPYYSDTRWIRYTLTGDESGFLPSIPWDRVAHGIRSNAWTVPASNTNRSTIYVRDSRVFGSVVKEINRDLGVARQEFADNYPGPVNIILALNGDEPGSVADNTFLSHGSSVSLWRDKNWSPASPSFDFPNSFRTAHTPTQGTAANQPTYRIGELNGHNFVRFDGTNDYMDTPAPIGITASGFTIYGVVRLNAAPSAKAATPDAEDSIITTVGGTHWGLTAHVDTGHYYLNIYNYDGAVYGQARVEVSLSTWYVVRARHFNGSVSICVNNAAESSTSSGNTAATTLGARLGGNNALTKFFNGDLAALLMFDTGDTAVQGANNGDATGSRLGQAFDIYSSLADRYRL